MSISRKDFLKTTGLGAITGMGLLSSPKKNDRSFVRHQIKPEALEKGATLSLVAPASPIYEDKEFEKMLVELRKLGFRIKLGKYVRNQRGYLAGTDQQRAEDLMNAFEDPETNGVLCIRGGWGCNRILPLLDFNVIRKNPKFFMGFSDITSLHMAIQKETGLVTFHGPVGKSIWTDLTLRSFKEVAWKGKKANYSLPENSDYYTIQKGKSRGMLLGGNLSVLSAMVGTGYLPSFQGSILFLEDVGESVYRIDRMLTQLKLAGILNEISGFIFGKCTDCEAGDNSLSMKEVFEDHIAPLEIPAFYGALISHEDDNLTLPVGIQAEMNAEKGEFWLLDSAVI